MSFHDLRIVDGWRFGGAAIRGQREFCDTAGVALVLGDSVFNRHGLPELLANALARDTGATVFGYVVADPERYGVVEMDGHGKAISIEQKPAKPKSKLAAPASTFTTIRCWRSTRR